MPGGVNQCLGAAREEAPRAHAAANGPAPRHPRPSRRPTRRWTAHRTGFPPPFPNERSALRARDKSREVPDLPNFRNGTKRWFNEALSVAIAASVRDRAAEKPPAPGRSYFSNAARSASVYSRHRQAQGVDSPARPDRYRYSAPRTEVSTSQKTRALAPDAVRTAPSPRRT